MKSNPLAPTLSRREREHSRPTLEIGGVSRLPHAWRRHPLSERERDKVRANLSAITNLMNNPPDPLTPNPLPQGEGAPSPDSRSRRLVQTNTRLAPSSPLPGGEG